jgi:hypothetical protein
MSSVQQNVIKHKVGLLNLAAELGHVSRACKVMRFSRDTANFRLREDLLQAKAQDREHVRAAQGLAQDRHAV